MTDTSPNPFAPPAVPDQPGYAAAGYAAVPDRALRPRGWAPPPPRSLRGLGRTTAALLAVQVVLGVVGAAVSAWGVLAWSRISSAPADLVLAPDRVEALLLLLQAPLSALTAIAFVGWMWVATANLRNAGARVRHAPGWALGAWLVPLLNLWRPKQMVDDLWRASLPGVAPGVDLRLVRKPVVITAWWAAYLVGTALPAIGVVKTLRATFEPMLQTLVTGTPPVSYVDSARLHETTAMWNMWGAVLMTVAAACAVGFVLRISRWQDERHGIGTAAHLAPTVPHVQGSWR